MVIALGATLGGWYAYMHYTARTAPSDALEAAHIVAHSDGSRGLLIVGEVELPAPTDTVPDDASARRLDLVDLNTGRRRARRELAQSSMVLPGAPGRIWHWHPRRPWLELIDAQTLEDAVSFDKLAQATPALSKGLTGSVDVDRWRGDAIVTTKRGEQLIISSTALKAQPISKRREIVHLDGKSMLVAAIRATLPEAAGGIRQKADSVHLNSDAESKVRSSWEKVPGIRTMGAALDPPRTLVNGVKWRDKIYTFGRPTGSPQKKLALDPGGGYRPRPIKAADPLLEPAFVAMYGAHGKASPLPDQKSLLVAHVETLGRDPTQLHLSRITFDGKKAWTISGGPGRVIMGHLEGDLLLIVVRGRKKTRSYVLGIAWRVGKVRWRYEA